jgi:hypothetical protein
MKGDTMAQKGRTPDPAPIDLEAQFVAEFAALTDRTEVLSLQISPLDAWILLSQIQLALRHPQNTGPSAGRARRIASELQGLVATSGALAIVARRGWHKEFDQ